MNETQAAARKSGSQTLGDKMWRIVSALLLVVFLVGIVGNYLGSGTMECTVTGSYVTIKNKRVSGMSNQGRTIETEQCGDLSWGYSGFIGEKVSAEELEKNHPELVQGETYVFQVRGYRFPFLAEPSIVGIEES